MGEARMTDRKHPKVWSDDHPDKGQDAEDCQAIENTLPYRSA
jgi:hypothetical protein